MPVKGVDISTFNGDVDMAALKREVEFVIIRCGYVSDYKDQDDVQYRNNVRKCEEYDMPYGVYLYSYATNTSMAKSEAQHTLRLLEGTKPSYGVWYDIEDSTLPKDGTLVDICAAYCSMIEEAGYYCGIYASLYFFNNYLSSARLDRYDKWVAQWADEITYTRPFGIWQYADNGVIGGKIFDMNLAFKDYPALTQQKGDDADMTIDEITKLIQTEAARIYAEADAKFKTIKDVPEWARAEVQKVYEELQLSGMEAVSEEKQIDASYTYVRALFVIGKLMEKLEEDEKNDMNAKGK